jgi:hypothetical protein
VPMNLFHTLMWDTCRSYFTFVISKVAVKV